MKKVLMTVEASKTGFSIYSENFPVHGYGKSVAEAKQDLKEAFDELILFYKEENRPFESDVVFEYNYDLKSIFNYFGIEGKKLAEKIGMNDSLLRQYTNGITSPSIKQKKRIEEGLHEIGRELLHVQL